MLMDGLIFMKTFFLLFFFFHRSKSTSDIQVDPTTVRQARYDELQKHRQQIKESEDKWQDVSIAGRRICLLATVLDSRQADYGRKVAGGSFVPNTEVRGEHMIYGICAAGRRAGVVVQSVATG